MARFQKGKSGNPEGRKPGVTNRFTEFRKLLEPHTTEITNKLIELAKAGEPNALRLVVERFIPKIKADNTITFDLPEGRIDTGDNMLKIIENMNKAVACGELSLEEADKLKTFLKEQRLEIYRAESKKREEIRDEEQRKRWAALDATNAET